MGASPRARNAATAPPRTSPDPPTPRVGFGRSCTNVFLPSVTTVTGPFKATVACHCRACRSANAMRPLPAGTTPPASRAASPSWGVSTHRCGSSFGQSSVRARAFSPSASTTVAAPRVFRSSAATNSSVPGACASPGPTRTARTFSPSTGVSWAADAVATTPGWPSASVKNVRLGSLPAIDSTTERALATVTTPAPQRAAARAASRTAPGYRVDPPTTRTRPRCSLPASGASGLRTARTARASSGTALMSRAALRPAPPGCRRRRPPPDRGCARCSPPAARSGRVRGGALPPAHAGPRWADRAGCA